MTDHTPGPWHVEHFGWDRDTHVRDAHDDKVAGVRNPADARLIAAAPDLLAAGSKVISLWEAMSQLRPERPWGFANDELDAAEVERMVELLDELSAAIAKVERDTT